MAYIVMAYIAIHMSIHMSMLTDHPQYVSCRCPHVKTHDHTSAHAAYTHAHTRIYTHPAMPYNALQRSVMLCNAL